MDTQNILNQESTNITADSNKSPENIFEMISFIVLLVTIVISPLVFLTSSYFLTDNTKAIVITFGILISFILYVISLFHKKSIDCSKNPLTIIGGLIIVSMFVSALLSTNIQKSLIGQGFELGSVSFLLIVFVSMFLVSRIVAGNKDRMIYVYSSLVFSFVLLSIFQIVRLFSPTSLSFGIFNTTTSSLIGSWTDLGIFAGVVFLITFFALNILSINKIVKVLLSLMIVLSGTFVFIVNSYAVWSVIALIMLAYCIYDYLNKTVNGTGIKKFFSRISIFALLVIVVSSVFIWKNTEIAGFLSKKLSISQAEISLPWQLTLDVAADTIKEKPLFGAGPNRFGSEFLLHKPFILNSTNVWDREFSTGFAMLPSFVVTQGLVGGILWILFLVFFVILGIKGLTKIKDASARFFIVSTFLVSSFLWMMSLLYSSSHVIVLFTFIIAGLFIAVLSSEGILNARKRELVDNSSFKNSINVILIVIITVSSFWTMITLKKVTAAVYFQSGMSIMNDTKNQDIEKAIDSFHKAIVWDKSDLYYQVISVVDTMKATTILQTLQAQSQKDPKSLDQNLIKQLNLLITDASSSTQSAINIDPTYYTNYAASAKVFELESSIQAKGAYESAKSAYMNALKYNPYSPQLYLSLAQVEASNSKMDEAQKYIGSAIQLKQNYSEAVFLLAQIQVKQGKTKDAINSVVFMTQINPANPMLFFQLGLLYYTDKNYDDAVIAFKKAVELDNKYANARYFLGLSLANLNKTPEAIAQFTEVSNENPDNQEVITIIANLKAGKPAFVDTKNSTDIKPEKRSTLPVKEKTTVQSKSKEIK